MPAYPNRPTSPHRSTLAYRTGPVPPISQQRQFLPNDMSRPVTGNPYELTGTATPVGGYIPRPSRPWFDGEHPAAAGTDPVGGETMVEALNRSISSRQPAIPQSTVNSVLGPVVNGSGNYNTGDYKLMMDRFGAMSRSRDALVRRNLEQAGGVRPKIDYEDVKPSLYERGLTPQQAAYVDNDLPQSPLTNTRFVGRMAEAPRDLSGSNGVRYGEIRPGVPLAYIPQHQSDGSIGQSRFVEGTERTGSYGTMRVERNPLTGGIALIGGGRPIRDENVEGQESGPYASRQELYARQQARSQAYKDTRAQRAYGRNPRLANAPAVADMRDRRSDVEYERTKARRRDAMLEQVQMAALQQQLKGMTPEQLNAFLGEMRDRPVSASRPAKGTNKTPTAKDVAEFKKRQEQQWRKDYFDKYGEGPYAAGAF